MAIDRDSLNSEASLILKDFGISNEELADCIGDWVAAATVAGFVSAIEQLFDKWESEGFDLLFTRDRLLDDDVAKLVSEWFVDIVSRIDI